MLDICLKQFKIAMGTPVEIEFAVDLRKDSEHTPTFYLLQIKHLVRSLEDFDIDTETIRREDCLLLTEKGMGNGMIDNISDVIYVDPLKFDRTRTLSIAQELDTLNSMIQSEDRRYILIGFGRWGTRDRFLGVPVHWPQISNAKIIVEADTKDFHIDASLGSHFFHNITSMNIGYFSIPYYTDLRRRENSFIDWEWLKNQPVKNRTEHLVHVRLEKPLTVLMDGRKSISLVYKPGTVSR
jgi:hypothetical protein